jgi:hypothetical protein
MIREDFKEAVMVRLKLADLYWFLPEYKPKALPINQRTGYCTPG